MTKGLLIDNLSVMTEEPTLGMVEIDGLDDWYKYLDCRCMDMQTRKVDGVWYDIWFDDEFLVVNRDFMPMSVCSEFDVESITGATTPSDYQNILLGNIVITRTPNGDEEDTQSLTDEDVNRLASKIRVAKTNYNDTKIFVLLTD